MQKPHCSPCLFQKASCSGCSVPSGASPSIVVTDAPSACTARQVHDFTATPSISTVHDAALAGVAADLRAGQRRDLAEEWTSSSRGSTSRSYTRPLTVIPNWKLQRWPPGCHEVSRVGRQAYYARRLHV